MRGRDAEFTAFVAARRGHLRRVAYAVCGDWHKADDVVQTALLKLYVAWPRIHRAGAEEAYARRIIVRTTIDESRRPWRREQPRAVHDDRPAPDEPSYEDRDAVVLALQRLPEMQRKVVACGTGWACRSTRPPTS